MERVAQWPLTIVLMIYL